MLAKRSVRQVATQHVSCDKFLPFITCVYIYIYLYPYEDIITTEVQIYIRGISLVRTSLNSSTKQLRTGLHEQLKTKSTWLVPLTSRNKRLRFNSSNFVNYNVPVPNF